MSKLSCRIGLSALFLNLLLGSALYGEPVEGESLLTPNQQRRIVRVNQDLPKDIVDQTGDSRQVTELRGRLRETVATYQQAVKRFGSGTPETKAAARRVMEEQGALHKQFVQEEAIPAVSLR